MPLKMDAADGTEWLQAGPRITAGVRIKAHVRIARLDHSIKQVFILPGIVLAAWMTGASWSHWLALRIFIGLVAATLIACSNYVLNEMLDAPFDRLHPYKRNRPAACGQVHYGLGYAQWLILMAAGMALAVTLSTGFAVAALALWLMGCAYNIAPLRTKDMPYIDVLTESINNPLRLCLGWYMVATASRVGLPPVSLLLSYWMLGAFFMALKRFSEFRQIGDGGIAASYRKSFARYNEGSLLRSVAFYGVTSLLLFAVFAARHRIELMLAFPLVAWMMFVYFGLAFQHESPVQHPEKLFREPKLMLGFGFCACAILMLLFLDFPWLASLADLIRRLSG